MSTRRASDLPILLCVVASLSCGVSVMGSTILSSLRAYAAAPAVPAYQEPARPAFDIAQLIEGEKMALLQMSSRVSVQALWFKLKERYSVPPFTLSTFVKLREFGLAEKKDGQRFHSLTWAGAEAANAVAEEIIRTENVHASYIGASYGKIVTVACCCGWSAAVARNERTQLSAARAFSNHLRSVEEAAKAQAEDMKTALAPVCQGIEQV